MRNAIAGVLLLAGCAVTPQQASLDELRKQVADAERAFARTMAERNFAAFTSFLSDEAIFYAGEKPIRGKQAVAADWKRFYEKPEAPFSWEPESVEVLDSGTLALSSGPVRGPTARSSRASIRSGGSRRRAPGASSSTREASHEARPI